MKQYYLIGEVSKLFDIPKQTLRYYEQEGILKSNKHTDNGYRLYNIEDIIMLSDVITYRDVGVPIKEIRNMFNTMDLENVIDTISSSEKRIKEKIAYYKKMEERINKRKSMSIEAKANLGIYKIVNSTDLKYFSITDYIDAMTLKKYLSDNYSYIVYLNQGLLELNKDIEDVTYGISIEDEEELKYFNSEVVVVNKNDEYVNTVIKVKNHTIENKDLLNIKGWLQHKGKKINGDLIGRYLTSSYGDSITDYYKIWIPISNV